LQQYTCECNQFRTGSSCQTDLRPCSSNPCLNNGTCSNIINNNNKRSFQCTCQYVFYGINCENKLDLCQNNTELCINKQGYCIMNGTRPICKCLLDYSGIKCEIMSTSLVVKNAIINAATLIAIVVLVSFGLLILFFDYTKYFLSQRSILKKHRIWKIFFDHKGKDLIFPKKRA
jgi:hypothetical protein